MLARDLALLKNLPTYRFKCKFMTIVHPYVLESIAFLVYLVVKQVLVSFSQWLYLIVKQVLVLFSQWLYLIVKQVLV